VLGSQQVNAQTSAVSSLWPNPATAERLSIRVKCTAIFRLVAISLLFVGHAGSQAAPAPQQDRSFNLGAPVPHPEDLSGIWEAPDGHGGVVGLHLILDTTTPFDTRTLAGVPQKWLGLSVGIYHRTRPAAPLEENSFSDSRRGGSVHYQDGRLTLHDLDNDLDLRHAPGDRWAGRFHRHDFDSNVTLSRPSQAGSQPWFVGVWKTSTGVETTCMHIMQSSAGSYLAWSDTLKAMGAAHLPPQVAKPPYSWERYGDLAVVEPAAKNAVWIQLGGTAICCPHRFLATPAGSKGMVADWSAGPNQSAHKSRWTRMPGNSCIAEAP
jgi:hypothetical protein